MPSQELGWVMFYRKSLNSSVWKNPKIWMVWSWILLKAAHQKTIFPFNGEDITLYPGQFITGIDKAVTQLTQISTQSYRTAIKYLKSTGRITTKATNKFTIITVCKWVEYQRDNKQTNKPVTNQQQTSNKPVTTYNNVNNENNVNTVYEEFKKKIKTTAILTTEAKKRIALRLKVFSLKDVLQAIGNFSKTEWQMSHNSHRPLTWFFHSDSRLESYRDIKVKPNWRSK